jgi:hypothetical protein
MPRQPSRTNANFEETRQGQSLKPNQHNVANADESDDDETKEQIAKQARELVAQKRKAKENNPLDRFKPDDDFDDTPQRRPKESGDVDVDPEPEEQLTFSEWLWSKAPPAPDLWRTSRNRELLKWSSNIKKNPFLKCCPISCLKFIMSRKTSSYTGQYEADSNVKQGVGVQMWPEPPFGEGSSYYGVWRKDQMSGHGILTFFEGDVYLGTFDQGEYHGYGVYKYSDNGAWKGDIYEGRYYKGMRQGSGVYYYIAHEASGKQGAVYIGEWIRGTMQGLGILT